MPDHGRHVALHNYSRRPLHCLAGTVPTLQTRSREPVEHGPRMRLLRRLRNSW